MIHFNTTSTFPNPVHTILVTGGNGLVGQALQSLVNECTSIGMQSEHDHDKHLIHPKYLPNLLKERWVFVTRKDADLRDLTQTRQLFHEHRPTHVLHLAAYVGGVFHNQSQQATFFMNNLLMNTNMVLCAHEFHVQSMVSCLSTCIFPDICELPLTESHVHLGPPHSSNFGYAYAKRMMDIMNNVYHAQYKCHFTSVIPTNLYGPHDQFHLTQSHVIPGLIHQCYLADTELEIKGSGLPLRQFLYSLDFAKILVWVVREYQEITPLIIAGDLHDEVSIMDVAQTIAKHMKFKGTLKVNPSYTDGQYRKTASNAKLRSYLPDFQFTSLNQ
ncbi:GDP-L-fucose synthase, partial [Coelomomyces lativittatus]